MCVVPLNTGFLSSSSFPFCPLAPLPPRGPAVGCFGLVDRYWGRIFLLGSGPRSVFFLVFFFLKLFFVRKEDSSLVSPPFSAGWGGFSLFLSVRCGLPPLAIVGGGPRPSPPFFTYRPPDPAARGRYCQGGGGGFLVRGQVRFPCSG